MRPLLSATLLLVIMSPATAFAGDCCVAGSGPGCDSYSIEQCVCAQDSYCCETTWDSLCAGEVEEFGCGSCSGGGGSYCPGYTGTSSCCTTADACGWAADGICDCQGTCSWDAPDCAPSSYCGDGSCDAGETCTSCSQDCGPCGGSGDCCEAQDGPGCGDAAIQACVCAQDDFCCTNTWDSLCAGEVEEFGCGSCSGGGPSYCPGYTGTSSCCTTADACGWASDGICDCQGTCAWDSGDCQPSSFCGDGACDAGETCTSCEQDCGPCGGVGDCCEAQAGPGCGDAGIQACVCAQDDYCCATSWDSVCAGEVEDFGCGSCGGGGEDYCPGYTGTSSCCTTADTCGWAADGICDCQGTCAWDSGDCQPSSVCGDGACDPGETCTDCAQDCGPCGGSGDCCAPQDGPGCGDAAIQACVCAQDDFCCTNTWDSLCVGEVEEFGCGACGGGGDEFCPGYTGTSSCCTDADACGWAADGICDCQGTCAWDSDDCGGGGPTCGDGACEAGETCTTCEADCGPCGGAGDCCEVQSAPGCGDPGIQACVCAQDDYCCATAWDSVCVGEVEDFGCGACDGGGDDFCPGYTGTSSCCTGTDPCDWGSDGICDCQGTCAWDGEDCGPTSFCGDGACDPDESCTTCEQDCGPCGGGGDCCEAQDGPGCGDAAIQACVCAQDDFCCTNTWDSVCVGEVEEFGCGACGGGGEDYCPGYTGTSSCCTTSDPCGWAADSICDCQGTCTWDTADCGGGGPVCGDGACDPDETCLSCEADCGPCGGAGDCCAVQDGPGCGDAAIQACVCAQDDFCCTNTWDSLCVGEVEEFGCGACGGGGDEFCPGYTGGSACCAPDDPCDWAADGICDCQGTCGWDAGDCGGGSTCGDGACDADENCTSCEVDCGPCGGGGDCCELQDTPGCGDAAVQMCVCEQDAFCCTNLWDSICVDEVEEFGCGNCGGGPTCGDGVCDGTENCSNCEADCGPCGGGGDCCTVQDTPGCGDAAVQACVCQEDPFCCANVWDQWCVDEVAEFGCGDCGGGGAVCGDGACDAGEDCANCEVDCGPCGGGGDCCEPQDGPGCDDPIIQGCICQQDAFCCNVTWDALCAGEVEELGCGNCGECVPDCLGKQCGGDGCGGTCGQCAPDASCQNGVCVGGCSPSCAGLQCGPDGCGGSCGDCTPGKMCQQGMCIPVCQPDCVGMQCGSDGCGGTCGSCPPGYFCQDGHCGQECIPSCADKECGDDGCGGTCGGCPPGWFCNWGKCSQDCVPDCAGKQCGDDGCGGTCGSCPPGYSCQTGHCTTGCSPNCSGKECGDDGCGGSCGSCGFGYLCTEMGVCEEPCQPECLNKECGDDGCGGSCGICGAGQSCQSGVCIVCAPDCLDKECGDDGCGGVCGECPAGTWCAEDKGWCLLDGEDAWSEDDVEDDAFVPGGGDGPCADNERLLYGKCVPTEPPVGEAEGKLASGCAAGGPVTGTPWLLLFLVGGLALLRRRRLKV
jgi:hypothetical protein